MNRCRDCYSGIVTVLFLNLCTPAAAGVYKWIDTDGVTHFAERAPANTAVKEIHVKPSSADPDAVQRLNAQTEASRISHEARIARRDEHKQRVEEQREQSRNCSNARNHRQRLLAANRLFKVNEEGVRERVGEAARTEDLERINKAIKQLCI